MTGILLLWLAFSPVQHFPAKQAQAEQLAQHRDPVPASPAAGSQVLVRNLPETIRTMLRDRLDNRQVNEHLYRFYAGRRFQTVWTSSANVSALLAALEEVSGDGLDPADYHSREIRELVAGFPLSLEKQALYDILLTDAYLTLASHLNSGKVDPERIEPTWNLGDDLTYSALEYRLQNALATNRVGAVLQELRPHHQFYGSLRQALSKYRSIEKSGGWPAIADGPSLREGTRDPRVFSLRKRFEASGDLAAPAAADTSLVYNAELAEAVKRFQRLNGMAPDGVVGTATLKALNVPVSRRIEQLRINLERYRWFHDDLGPTYIMVNIPEFTLQYVENGSKRWSTRVIVGKPFRETPIFKADMQYIIFNPQWVVPPTILEKDALPAIRRNVGYLSQKRLKVIDSDGRAVDPSSVNWQGYSASNFPYRLQQTAGDHGSLGRIKFMLPNRYIVYLHDTPSKELFQKNVRTFSSGCIRVEHPFELAELVLSDSVRWNGEKIRAAIGKGRTSTVYLPKRIPVFILYMTAVPSGGEVVFLEDVYGRDEKVLKALDRLSPALKTAGPVR